MKDVPAGATVVGIPGRVVTAKKDDAQSSQRRAMAEKIGFDAYGQHHGQLPDPITQALDRILDHLHRVDDRLEKLDRAIEPDSSLGERHREPQQPLPLAESKDQRKKGA